MFMSLTAIWSKYCRPPYNRLRRELSAVTQIFQASEQELSPHQPTGENLFLTDCFNSNHNIVQFLVAKYMGARFDYKLPWQPM